MFIRTKPEFLVQISEEQMMEYILSLSPNLLAIENDILTGLTYNFNNKNPVRDLAIIQQKIYLSLFNNTSIGVINNNPENENIQSIEGIGDPSNLFSQNEIGSDFLYYISNKSNDISNNLLADKAKSALSFLDNENFIINWKITFQDVNIDSKSFVLYIQTSTESYNFLIDYINKNINIS